MAKTVAELVNHRADGRKLPVNFPESWLPLSVAVGSYGEALLGGPWHHWSFALADGSAVYPEQPDDERRPIFADKVAWAQRHCRAVAESFTRACVARLIKTGYSKIGGGAVEPMEADLWRTDDLFLRFKSYSFDPANPFSEGVDLPCWIWVDITDLQRECRKLTCERNGWTELPENWRERLVHVHRAPPVGRKRKSDHVLELFAARIRAGTVVRGNLSKEGRAIFEGDLGNPDRATAKVTADQIRQHYNALQFSSRDDSILNANAVLGQMKML